MQALMTSLRISVATLLVCVAGYTLVLLGLAQTVTPETARGSLITRPDGSILGSRLIAQKFESPGYFWPRPSAPDYDASRAAGSNVSTMRLDLPLPDTPVTQVRRPTGIFAVTPRRLWARAPRSST